MSTLTRAQSAQVNRRTIIRSAAWSVPVVSIVGVAAPAFACSPVTQVAYSADLLIDSFVGTKEANGHTLGTFTFAFRNNGQATIPAGTSYTVTVTAMKAPGNPSGDKNIVVGVGQHTGLDVTPSANVSLSPDGPTSQVYTVVVTAPVPVGTTASVVFNIDTATGIGATRLGMTAQLRDFGSNPCSVAAAGNESYLAGEWGQGAVT